MGTPGIHRTQVDLDGLLEVLSRNLYSTPIVVVRELIQNAHDACIRRRSESNWDDEPRIQVISNAHRNTLTITDNGSGLTHDEIVEYLATIGSGYTRKLRQSSSNQDAIGYFGLGFMTAYVVASKVEFLTTSFQQPNQASRFVTKGGKQYHLTTEAAENSVGSSVVLHLLDDHARLADGDYLNHLVSRYCCLLPMNVYVNDAKDPVNSTPVPWQQQADTSELRKQRISLDFAKLFDGQFEPITTIPIPHDKNVKISGLIWIQDGSFYANSDNRCASVFIRHMHITDDTKELLPDWAGFAGCVVDSHSLVPTASRETIQKNDAYEIARTHIRNTLIEALVNIASERGATWRRLQSRHNQSLLGACLADEQLFEKMHDVLELPTSAGDMTASEIVRRTAESKLTVAMEQKGGFEQLVAKSTGTPLVYGFRYAVMAFCRELAKHTGVSIRTLGGEDDESMFPVYNPDEELTRALTRHFEGTDAKLVISKFAPASLPAIYVLDQDALLKHRLESDELDRAVGSATITLARSFTQNLQIEHEAYFYVNANNSLIKKFHQFNEEKQQLVARSIIAITKLLSNDNLSSDDSDSVESMLDGLTTSLKSLAETV